MELYSESLLVVIVFMTLVVAFYLLKIEQLRGHGVLENQS